MGRLLLRPVRRPPGCSEVEKGHFARRFWFRRPMSIGVGLGPKFGDGSARGESWEAEEEGGKKKKHPPRREPREEEDDSAATIKREKKERERKPPKSD